jgi:multidrug resistance protein, MATE family
MASLSNEFKAELKATLKLALPIIISQLSFILMGVADTMQVGHMEGPAKESVGAAALANGLFFTIVIIGLLCIQIVSPLVANAHANNNTLLVKKHWHAGLFSALFLSVFCTGIIVVFAYNFGWLGQQAIISALAIPYLKVIGASILPMLLFNAARQLTDGMSLTKPAMYISIAALCLNVLANHVLINGWKSLPAMGLYGAGIATLLARIFMAVAMFGYILSQKNLKPYIHKLKANRTDIMSVLKIGIPSGLQGFFEVAIFAAASILIGKFGASALAAHQIALNPASTTYMMVTGVAAGGGIRVGALLGNPSAVRRAGLAALCIGGSFMLLCCVLFMSCNHIISGWYINDPEVLPLAASLLIIAGIFQLSDGIQAVALGILRGKADVNIPTIITLIAYWVIGLPVGYYLAFYTSLKTHGIWYGLTLGLTVSAVWLTFRFFTISPKQ